MPNKPTPTQATVTQDIHAIVAEQMHLSVDDVQPTSRLVEDLGADSLDLVETVLAIEELFKIEMEVFFPSEPVVDYQKMQAEVDAALTTVEDLVRTTCGVLGIHYQKTTETS